MCGMGAGQAGCGAAALAAARLTGEWEKNVSACYEKNMALLLYL